MNTLEPSRLPPPAPEASVEGLHQHPCDPLLLAVRLDGRPLSGLTGRVDWRLGGRLSALVAQGALDGDAPLLVPAPRFFPIGRLVLWRLGAATPSDLARLARSMKSDTPGLCPDDFGFTEREIRAAFADRVVIYLSPGT